MNSTPKIAFAGCKDTTFECMDSLLKSGLSIDLLITIRPTLVVKNNVSGFMDLTEFAHRNNIEVYHCNTYTLNSEIDKKNMEKFTIDLLFVIGWQRLIPEWLLKELNIGAFGMHGASQALPFGRGRSPLNWSLIQNKELFITNLFKYRPGIDDGDILDTQLFEINQFDSGKTLHYKNTLSMIKLIHKNIDSLLSNKYELKKQLNRAPTYYPKRNIEDGVIFWDKSTSEIYNLIRAVTNPFPGAFTFLNSSKITIWEAIPFDKILFDPYLKPGLILHVFINGDFIVKTGDGTILIKKYDMEKDVKIIADQSLNSLNYSYKNPYIYPE